MFFILVLSCVDEVSFVPWSDWYELINKIFDFTAGSLNGLSERLSCPLHVVICSEFLFDTMLNLCGYHAAARFIFNGMCYPVFACFVEYCWETYLHYQLLHASPWVYSNCAAPTALNDSW